MSPVKIFAHPALEYESTISRVHFAQIDILSHASSQHPVAWRDDGAIAQGVRYLFDIMSLTDYFSITVHFPWRTRTERIDECVRNSSFFFQMHHVASHAHRRKAIRLSLRMTPILDCSVLALRAFAVIDRCHLHLFAIDIDYCLFLGINGIQRTV